MPADIGWRKTMEDAAIHEVDLKDGNSLFAVFDGHGGTIRNIKDIKLVNTLNQNSSKYLLLFNLTSNENI